MAVLVVYRNDKTGPVEGARVFASAFSDAHILYLFSGKWRFNFTQVLVALVRYRQHDWIGFGFLPDLVVSMNIFAKSRSAFVRGDLRENYKCDHRYFWQPLLFFHGFILRRMSRCYVLTDFQKDLFIKDFDLDPNDVYVSPNCVDGKKIKRIKHRPSLNFKRLVVVGSLTERKRPDLALTVCSYLNRQFGSEYECHFFGNGPLEFSLKDHASVLGVTTYFHGFVSDYLAELDEADIILHCSKSEGASRAVLECLAAGLCVVTFNWPGVDECIKHNKNGFICQDEFDAVQIIARFVRNKCIPSGSLLVWNDVSLRSASYNPQGIGNVS